MAEYQERNAPATGLGKALQVMTPTERIIMFIAIPLALLVGVQFLAQMIVVAVTGGDMTFLGVLPYLGLWGASDPAARYGVPGAGVLHWVTLGFLVAIALAALVMVAIATSRRNKDPQRRPGIASRESAIAEMGSKQLVEQRGPHLRPSLKGERIEPEQVGFRVGEFRGSSLWFRVEDPIILIGPSRSGKGWRLLLNWILSAPGAVVTTSVRMDNAKLTLQARERGGGPCYIFAPGIDGGEDFGHVMRWDPVDGCIDERTLVRRMSALIPSDSFSGSTSNGGHWDTLGRQLASHLFHAAACGGLTVDDIWEWVGSPRRAEQAVRLIREHPQGLPEHATHLETVLGQPPEQLASSWGVLPTVLSFMDSRAARDWMKPAPEETVDWVEFIMRRGTLYLIGDKKGAGAYTRIIDGVLAEVDYISKGMAMASPGNRLDPPITYVLDEAGNIEYQGMYEGITAGGGSGRIIIAVFQSKSQLAQFGGAESADTLWDAAVAKVILPGGGDPKALDEISQLIGETWIERESHTVNDGSGISRSFNAEQRAILTKSEIRELPTGYAIVFYRNLRPVIVSTSPFDENARWEECRRDSEELDAMSKANSPYAASMREIAGGEHA